MRLQAAIVMKCGMMLHPKTDPPTRIVGGTMAACLKRLNG